MDIHLRKLLDEFCYFHKKTALTTIVVESYYN